MEEKQVGTNFGVAIFVVAIVGFSTVAYLWNCVFKSAKEEQRSPPSPDDIRKCRTQKFGNTKSGNEISSGEGAPVVESAPSKIVPKAQAGQQQISQDDIRRRRTEIFTSQVAVGGGKAENGS